ncbi:MAG: transposase [Planctomycetota bacterium]
MYRKASPNQLTFDNFYLPFGGHLRSDNRWVVLADQVPWQQIEEAYGELFSDDNDCPAKSARMALGALLIKERLGTSDRETVEQICENPYLQYFLGLMEYHDEVPFDHSMLTHFRKRFDKEMLADINESIVGRAMGNSKDNDSDSDNCNDNDNNNIDADTNDKQRPSNQGKLIADATCTPADIAYPTDLSLVNEAREKSEEIIDAMHEPFMGVRKKPRTYRQKARKAYLTVAKQKKPGAKKIRKAIGPVEFGAKVSISLVGGFSFVERIGWDAYNESCDLIEQIEQYRKRFGFYPESVHVDKIYRTKDNRRFCKKHGIRLSGPPLGRPTTDADLLKAQRKIQYQDEVDRIAVEGKFGQGKRRFSLAG